MVALSKVSPWLLEREYIPARGTVARADIEYKGALIDAEMIAGNSYNLLVSSYVEPEDIREEVDIAELNERIAGIVERQAELRAKIDAIVADLEGGVR